MKVKLIAHSQVSQEFVQELYDAEKTNLLINNHAGEMIALSAIRTCYSADKPSEIVVKEGDKYFKQKSSEGKGKEVDRLIRHIVSSGHTSTLEHISFTFAIEGVSRALLAQLTRHRVGFSFSVQSQRYVKQSTDSKHGGFEYVVPEKVKKDMVTDIVFHKTMEDLQRTYDYLIAEGVPQEDARAVLPNAATCNLVMTANLTALLGFYGKRRAGKGAQKEITELAELIKEKVIQTEPWTAEFFGHEETVLDTRNNKIKSLLDRKGSTLSNMDLLAEITKLMEVESVE